MYLDVLLGFSLVLGAVSLSLSSDFTVEGHYGNEGMEKTVKRRQAAREYCSIPPPMKNGKYRSSRIRCLPNDTTPACMLMEGAFVFTGWPIFLDYCDPGYKSTDQVAVCTEGRWSPRLPACEACTLSHNLVKGKPVCKGDVVFEDTFNEPLSSKWQHDISFGSEGWKFNVFTSDKKNSFTENGSLVIRPTVSNGPYVTSAAVELEGCSGSRKYCVRTGSPDMVLPPVASALLDTRHSFTFTYGEVEIRAKLPKGDWLMPSMFLYPKRDYYGYGITSGCLDFGVTLGNSDFQCSGEGIGIGRAVYKLAIGPENHLMYKEWVVSNQSMNLYNEYHTYTIIWKPDSIAFKFDNELVKKVSTKEKTLCETFPSLTEEDCMIYSEGSNMAPYDKKFYIVLGLPAGDLGSKTDGCMNSGTVKPWKFEEPKAVTKFWQDRGNWLPTWTEEGSSLYIDYVRVTAV